MMFSWIVKQLEKEKDQEKRKILNVFRFLYIIFPVTAITLLGRTLHSLWLIILMSLLSWLVTTVILDMIFKKHYLPLWQS